MPYDFGDVVLVKFPFTNQTAFKQRPAVIVSNLSYSQAKPDIVVMAITSQLRARQALERFWLTEWKAANLLKPSSIKPVFATLEQSLILESAGHLQAADLTALRSAMSAILG
jgi:mRNA interferase MazF